MSMNLNEELANLSVTYRGLAEAADRESLAREEARNRASEYGQSPANLPDPADSKRVAAYWRFHEKTAKDGFLYYEDPPPGSQRPQVAIPSYYSVTTEAIAANRIRYGSANDPWKFTDFSTARPPAAPAKEIPATRPWPGPTTGNRGTPSAPPPAGPRGTGELSKKERRAAKKLARKG